MMMGQQVVGGTATNFKTEDKKNALPAHYGNSYTKPLDETQINGINSKRMTPGPAATNSSQNRNNIGSTSNIFGQAQQTTQLQNFTNGFARGSGSATNTNQSKGVKDALNYTNIPAPKIATTNVRVSFPCLDNNPYRPTGSDNEQRELVIDE